MISKPVPTRFSSALTALALALCISACTSPSTGSKTAAPGQPECYWKGDGVVGSPKIVISLSEQCVRYFKGGQLVGVCPISSGREGHSTVAGRYRILEKDFDHRSSLYGAFCDAERNIVQEDVDVRRDTPPPGTRFIGAEMRGFMRITGAVGMHEGYLPGFPASHGCIRLPAEMAAIFYRETPTGTPVQIVGDASEAVFRPPPPAAAQSEQKKKSQRGGLLGSNKKAKAASSLRGQTLYLE